MRAPARETTGLRASWEESHGILRRDAEARVAAMSRVFPGLPISRNVGLPRVVAARGMSGTDLQQVQTSLDIGRRLGFLASSLDVTAISAAL